MPGSLIVVNPRAARARDASTLAALTERVGVVLGQRDGIEPRLVETRSRADVGPLVQAALEEGAAAIIGVGGDGTLRDIAAAIAGSDVPLGIVPVGTGNQVAHVMGIPGSPARAIDALLRARPRRVDLGEVTVRRADGSSETSAFLLGCGAGFDAQLMERTSPDLKRRLGTAAYFLHGARLALRLTAWPCRLAIDGRVLETEVTAAIVGNMGQLVPGRLGLRLPLDPADGLLDLIVVSARGPVRGLTSLADQARRTRLGGEPGDPTMRLRGTAFEVHPLEPLPLQVDGDGIGLGRFEAGVRPGAVTILAP